MTTITFVRMRPAESVVQRWAESRRNEGATTVEVKALTEADCEASFAAGIMPVAGDDGIAGAPAHAVSPARALDLGKNGVPGWQLTLVATDDRADTIDALARTQAAFLRVGRSKVADGSQIAGLPGVNPRVSTFVDKVEEALIAVEAGATDLLLRGWNTDTIGQLRDVLPFPLIERTIYPTDVNIDQVREHLDPPAFKAYLDLVDASGVVRTRTDWAPGKDLPAPNPPGRFSAQWSDDAWASEPHMGGGDAIRGELRRILDRSLEGQRPSRNEIQRLFEARGTEVDAIASVADILRQQANGEKVSFVVNRNINYTNQCTYKCGFCAFSKGPRSLNLREDPYLLTVPHVVERAVEAWNRGATEVCLQGGIHPDFTGDFYITVLEAIKEAVPGMHVHGFTPLEVWQGAETLGIPVREFLTMLRDAGLGTLPGTAAEILDDRVREYLCPDKIRTAQWAEVMMTAHDLGLRSTATMMFGHIDDPTSWANHFETLRVIQRATGGFTEFVPLPFVHMGAPIYLRGAARPGPTWDEVVLVHSVARIAFDGLINNIQASWVKLGLEAGLTLLTAGANDLGGTLMDEYISAAAGASHGSMKGAADFTAAIESIGRVPQRRTTLYRPAPTIRVVGGTP
ncbi:MAG: 5-amino-6-(D-ribitylamino)uracil--L-tyrosine 4-hydroxyphenyl transferase CofH [Actinomycetota bacterium]|nr:5-amino-6-(D-ribitylamino)uracil--L-tyrosine 4-hydroxyphenyl transferase CofH [Actinomycetota bacterium]